MPPRKRKAAATTGSAKKEGAATTGGKKRKTSRSEGPSRELERGHMYILFRPKVGVEEAHSYKDVQRMYIWLAPEKVKLADGKAHPFHTPPVGEVKEEKSAAAEEEKKAGETKAPPTTKGKHRLLIVPRKRLPGHTHREQEWAFVDEVGDDVGPINEHLGKISYHTQTRGDRTIEEARVIAECTYVIVEHGNVTNLVYELIEPPKVDAVQKAFNIEKEGVLMIQVKNPHRESATREGQPMGLKEKEKPKYPKELQKHFEGIRVAEVKFTNLWPQMLDYKGTELLLLGMHEKPTEEVGKRVVEELEKMSEEDMVKSDKEAVHKIQKETGLETKPVLHSLEAGK